VYRSSVLRKSSLLAALLLAAGVVRADPLDKVTGTEDWHKAGPQDTEAEWKDWYKGRVAWRRGARDLRVQRVISVRLARLLLRADDPGFEQLKRIIQAGLKAIPDEAAPQPAPGPRPRTTPRRRPGPRPRPAPPPPPPTQVEAPEPTEADSESGGYTEVPVERLDDKGQAIDEEGDRELQRVTGKKKAPPPAPKKKR
jgi:hypothetical protein